MPRNLHGQAKVRYGQPDALYRRLRWQLPISFVVIVAALAVLATRIRNPWSWSLFGWGLVIGVSGAAVTQLTLHVLSRQPEVTARDRERVKARRPLYLILWLAGGALIGGVASIFDQGRIDVVGAVYSAFSIFAGIVLFFVLRRRIRAEKR